MVWNRCHGLVLAVRYHLVDSHSFDISCQSKERMAQCQYHCHNSHCLFLPGGFSPLGVVTETRTTPIHIPSTIHQPDRTCRLCDRVPLLWQAIPAMPRTLRQHQALTMFLTFSDFLYLYPTLLLLVSRSCAERHIPAAGHITQTCTFTSTMTAILTSIVIKHTRYYKYFITAGVAIYLLGVGLMIRYYVEGSLTSQIVGTQIAVGSKCGRNFDFWN